MSTHQVQPIGRVLRLRDLVRYKKRDGSISAGKTGLGKTTLYKMIAEGTFPRPVQLGPGSVAWKERDIEAWLQSRPIANNASPNANNASPAQAESRRGAKPKGWPIFPPKQNCAFSPTDA